MQHDQSKTEDRISGIELDLRRARFARELLLGFVFLLVAHVVAFRTLLNNVREANGYTWIAFGAIGTLSVWFACAARPLAQRLSRAGIAIAFVFPFSMNAVRRVLLPQQSGIRFPYPTLSPAGFVPLANIDSTQSILACWLAGATVAAYAVHWFFGLVLVPPDLQTQRKQLSLRSIFLLTVVAALLSVYIRGPNWQNRISYFTNGITLGLLACSVSYTVFNDNTKWTSRLFVPLVAVLAVIVFDLSVGGLTGMWGGNVFSRLNYVGAFATLVCVSPAFSFLYLKQLGYSLSLQGSATNA